MEALAAGCFPILPDRLAYPEHLPEELRVRHLYNNEEDMMEKLEKAVSQKLYLKTDLTQEFINKYDWSSLIELYDNLI